jgi:ABC-2 type transport system ATP-binding protein
VKGLAVEVTDLVMRYSDNTAVDGLSLTVESGGVTAVLGPNGAGKTTTLETCEGYRRPQAGQVRVLGRDPYGDHLELAPRIGVMLQQGGAWSAARADEMLRYVASLHAHPQPVGELMDRLGLRGCGRTPYRRLSGGQQQRVGIAMAVIGRPELVFLDEPTAGLDPQARHATWELIEELATAGVTVILTTHYIEEAERLADQVHVLDHGKVLASGSPAQLTARTTADTIRFAAPGLDVTALAAALPRGCAVSGESGGQFVVQGRLSPETLAVVTSSCAAQGIMPQGLTVGRTTLEDVFLELTGRELRG